MTMRMPIRMNGEAIDMCTRSIRRGSGHGTSKGWFEQSGETRHLARVAASTSLQAAAMAGVGQGDMSVEAG